MKIWVNQIADIAVNIDIELPHYYKCVLRKIITGENKKETIYGKIKENETTTITKTEYISGEVAYKFRIQHYLSLQDPFFSHYLQDEYKSNENEYNAIKNEALEFLNNF